MKVDDGIQWSGNRWFDLRGSYIIDPSSPLSWPGPLQCWLPDLRATRWHVYTDFTRREVAIGTRRPEKWCQEEWRRVYSGRWTPAWELMLSYINLFSGE